MRQLGLIIVALASNGSAMASDFSATGGGTGEPATPTSAIDEYTIDDGSKENAVGLTAGGRLIYLNSFTVLAGFEIVTAVRVAWGQTPAGLPAQVLVWDDPNNDGNPSDVTFPGDDLLTSAPTASVASIAPPPMQSFPCDFQTVPVPPALVGAPGDRFFVGVCVDHATGQGQFPAALDETDPDNGRSWVGGGGTTVNCGNPNGGTIGSMLNIDAIGLPGDWCVRANATGATPVMASTWGSIKATYTQ